MLTRLLIAIALLLPAGFAQAASNDCIVTSGTPTLQAGTSAPCYLNQSGEMLTSGSFSGSISGADGAIVDGSNAALKATVLDLTNSNPVTTAIVDSSGNQITSFGGGTEVTEDAAAAANPTGKMDMCRRRDTLTASEVSADSDVIAKNCTSKGEVYVKQTDPVAVTGTFWQATQPVSGTVAATQSGTWTMQPGNTANTTPWVFSIQQGGNTAAVNASSQLSVNCANCSGSGVSQQDNTGFTPGTTNFVPMGGEVDDTGTTAVTENNAGVARITAQRAVHMNLRNNSGTEIGTSGNPLVVGDGSGAMNVIVDSGTISINQTTTANDVDATVANFPTTASTSAISVRCVNTAGNAFETCGGTGGSGGTSSNFGSAFPTPGTAAGFTDGTNMVAGRVVTSAPGTSDAGLVVRPISPASSTIASAVPSVGVQVTGTDGTNARALKTDTNGELQVDVLTMPTVTVTDGSGALNTIIDSGTVTVTQATGTNLHMVCDSGCSSSSGFADNGAFTFGTTAINPIGGVFDDTSSNTATENSAAIARITQNKALHMNLRNASGTEIGTASNAVRTDPIGTTAQPVTQTTAANLNMRPDTSGATGAAPPARANYAGGLQSGATGGFLGGFAVCDSFVNVNVSTATTTALITGVSGRHVRICGMSLVTAAANNVALISGTGATCGTGTTGMSGGTTAASGWNFAANGGLTQGNGLGTVNQTNATGDSVCIITSAATQLSGRIAYAIY
jgi:hypothetical protein